MQYYRIHFILLCTCCFIFSTEDLIGFYPSLVALCSGPAGIPPGTGEAHRRGKAQTVTKGSDVPRGGRLYQIRTGEENCHHGGCWNIDMSVVCMNLVCHSIFRKYLGKTVVIS